MFSAMRSFSPAVLVVVVLGGASCAGSAKMSPAGTGGSGSYASCSSDANCGQTAGCVRGTCLPRLPAPAPAWAIEIRPSSSTASAPVTEIVPAPTTWKLLADDYFEASATFIPFNLTTALPGSANVVLELPSRIPGRAALTFESAFSGGGTTATLRLPTGTRSRSGTLKLVPLSPADQTNPPYWFSATVPEVGASLTASGTTTSSFKLPANNLVQGVLRDAFAEPKTAYTARAYRDGALVSNSAVTQTDGRFQLSVPATVMGQIAVELAPPTASDPWFIYNKNGLAGPSQDVGTVILPAYQVPVAPPLGNVFHVESDEVVPASVGNAAIRALTILSSDSVGATWFWQSTTTDMAGDAKLSLIPGMNQTARTYEVSVIPPPDSPFASTCKNEEVLSPTDRTTIKLSERRKLLTGTVSSALGAPIGGVTVTATRDAVSARVCTISTMTGPTTFTTVTNASGFYSLYVDADTYRIDYDPPAGSSAPRLTRPKVDVAFDINEAVQLPTAALVEGDAVGPAPDEAGLPYATVRIFEACSEPDCTTPRLIGETQTDAQGHFRAVVAAPTSN